MKKSYIIQIELFRDNNNIHKIDIYLEYLTSKKFISCNVGNLHTANRLSTEKVKSYRRERQAWEKYVAQRVPKIRTLMHTPNS